MRSKLLDMIVVTILEGVPVFLWLYAAHDGAHWTAVLWLVLGELLETAYVALRLERSPVGVGDPDGARSHRRRMFLTFSAATVVEIGIWLAWLWLWRGDDVPNWVAHAGLLVAMHLKHQLEAASIRDTSYFSGLLDLRGLLASVAETGGAVGALELLDQNEPVLAAVAFFAGLMLEHVLLLIVLYREKDRRDISLPRLQPPRLPLRLRLLDFAVVRFGGLWRLAQRFGPTRRLLNRAAIHGFASQMPARPNPLSTMADYTTWASLTDRKWSGRHLPPSVRGTRSEPSLDAVAALFQRQGDATPCVRSTVLFTYFAQWFTDGFLRTERARDRTGLRDTRRNESTHDVDLAQLYGLNAAMTQALRRGHGGLLRSQRINGEEFPEYLCCHGQIRWRFRKLPRPIGFRALPRAQRDELFAMGTDTRNMGFVAFNVLFLREHNRIAGRLAANHPDWDDERLFGTARNILIVVLLRIVVEEYINHITGVFFKLHLPTPKTFVRAPWMRPNWMAIEFNLLYRWHSLVPGRFWLGGIDMPISKTLSTTAPLTANGLRAFMLAASAQRAGRIRLFNTHPDLVAAAEKPSIAQGRAARLRSYNDYRELCGLPRARHFREFSSDQRVYEGLKGLYDGVDDIEFYVGLFAEEAAPSKVLPPLMTMMVAFDAFTQVLTNPLVAPHVYGPQTFSETGMKIIEETSTIKQLVSRNVPEGAEDDFISMTQDRRGRG